MSAIPLDGAAFARALEAAPDVLVEEISRGLTEASLLLEREVRERTPTSGAGTLRDSIGALPVTLSGHRLEAGVGTSLAYAVPVETGSRPHMPPVEPLVDWVERRLGKRGDEARRIAWGIAFKIKAQGTKGAFMFRDAHAATAGQVERILDAALGRTLERIGGRA